MPAEGDDSGSRGDALSAPTETTADSGHQAPVGAGEYADRDDGEPPALEPAPEGLADQAETTEAAAAGRQEPQVTPETPLTEGTPTVAQPTEAPPAEFSPGEIPPSEVPPTDASAPEPPAPEPAAPGLPAPEPALIAPATAEPSADAIPAAELRAALTEIGGRVDELAAAAAELSRLRSRDTELIARLHEDVTRLRSGEIAAALNPVVTGMIKLHDQMVSLGALDDPASPAGLLHTQLLQIMELTCAVRPFTPAVGERFDASHHTGTRRRPTTDASLDGTIAAAIKAGFVRADGSVVRVAEVEVHRWSA